MNETRQANNVIAMRKSSIEFFAITLLIALGVNFTATGFSDWLAIDERTNTMMGISVIVISCTYLVIRSGFRKRRTIKMDGVFVIDDNNGDILPIHRYDFSETLERTFKAARAENKALFRNWTNGRGSEEQNDDDIFINNPSSQRVLIEMVEYFIIKNLSLHLNAYFITNNLYNSDEVITLDRNKIPEVLLQNRILDLFSRPMEDREAFSDNGEAPDGGKIVLSYGEKGEIFDHLEIELPRKTTFTRDSDKNLNISTPRFSITIKIEFEGMNTNLPRDFEQLYLRKEFLEVSAFAVKVEIYTNFSLRSLLTDKGWEYYLWLDSFIDSLNESFSFRDFVNSIGWDQALTNIIVNSNLRSKKNTDEIKAKSTRIVMTKTPRD